MTAPVIARARGWPNSCESTCCVTSASAEIRVTMMAVAVDSSSEGICATSPSPMVSSV